MDETKAALLEALECREEVVANINHVGLEDAHLLVEGNVIYTVPDNVEEKLLAWAVGGTLGVLKIPGTSHEEPVGVYPAHDARHHGKQDVKARRPEDGVPRIPRLRTPED